MSEAFVILGNQLFPLVHLTKFKKNNSFFMQEDYGLCTYVKHHKLKIYHFLASMREYRDLLKAKNFDIHYIELEENITNYKNYFQGLYNFIKTNNIHLINIFEIEDLDFREEFLKFAKKNNLKINFHHSPMFLLPHKGIESYINQKHPKLSTFYSNIRSDFNILIEQSKPVGGKWSFDDENRKRVPKGYKPPRTDLFESKYYEKIELIVNKYFSNHFGNLSKKIVFPFNSKDSQKVLANFIKYKLINFGNYEDFIDHNQIYLNHSLLSAPLNMGLITPLEIREALDQCDFNQYGLNNFEGFVRQIFGWREFIRFLNIKYYTDFHTLNFFSNSKSLTKDWYNGSTSIPILNDMIKTLKDFGYLHHIPRLMIISNIMNLTGIKPQEVYKWFMETFIDSSDWVMTPNVFGMGLYSDGGIFATKPYICGSNYLLKMSNYAKGPWIKELDGLYWNFIDKNKNFFKSNHRLSMMYYALQKMDKSKISEHKKYANEFIKKHAK